MREERRHLIRAVTRKGLNEKHGAGMVGATIFGARSFGAGIFSAGVVRITGANLFSAGRVGAKNKS